MKKIFSTEETIEKHIHKIYLVLALVIGMILSLAMPLFNEPDGQYHYTVSTNIAGLSNDLSAYGEVEIVTGIDKQIPSYQSGNFFEKYFKNEIKKMPITDLPRAGFIPPKTSYNYWGHLLPALGAKLGYMVYPSIGVMVVFTRLLSTFVCAIIMFFIIKWVKAGKLLFTVISLSPVMTNTFASLSYDGTTYILAAFAVAFTINLIIQKEIRKRDIGYLGLIIVSLMFGAKTNLKIFMALPLFVMVSFLLTQNRTSRFKLILNNIKSRLETSKLLSWRLSIIYSITIFLMSGVTLWFLKPTIIYSLYRITVGYWVNISSGLSVSSIFQSLLAAPYAPINKLPYWVSAIWYILLVIVLLVEKRFVKSMMISIFSLLLFLAGLVAVFYSFVTYPPNSDFVGANRFIGAIAGVQGRYFTPTLLLLPLVTGNEKFALKINPYRLTVIMAIIVIVITNIMLLFSTLFGIYFLY